MECSKIRAILFEHADVEIPPELREEVSAHLAVCKPCQMLFEALEEQARALGSMPRLGAPANLLENVRSRLEKPSMLSTLRHWMRAIFAGKQFFGLAGAAAAAMLLILTVHVAFRDEGSRKVLLSRAPSTVEAPAPSAGPPPLKGARAPGNPAQYGIDRSASAPFAASSQTRTFGSRFSPNTYEEAKKAPTSPPAGRKLHGPASAARKTPVVALVLKLPAVSAEGGTKCDLFEPNGFSRQEGFSPSNRALSGSAAHGEKMPAQSSPRRIARPDEYPSGTSRPEFQKVFSEVIRLVKRSNGRVLNAPEAGSKNRSGMLLAEVPGPDFRLFLAGMRRLGEVEFKEAKEVTLASNAAVRVSISLKSK